MANVDAERAVSLAYQIEFSRTKVKGGVMFKSVKALHFTLSSPGRQLRLRPDAARRQFDPGYRNKNNLQMETDYQFIVRYKRTF